MREILFRGKRLDNGEWVEGAFLDDGGGAFYICPAASDITYGDNGNRRRIGCWYKVDPATVGQYTGLTDKNGKRIFEGDVVRDMEGTIYPVVCGCAGFYLRYDTPYSHGLHYDLLPLCNYWHAHGAIVEIIGNIHDNPELQEGGADNG